MRANKSNPPPNPNPEKTIAKSKALALKPMNHPNRSIKAPAQNRKKNRATKPRPPEPGDAEQPEAEQGRIQPQHKPVSQATRKPKQASRYKSAA